MKVERKSESKESKEFTEFQNEWLGRGKQLQMVEGSETGSKKLLICHFR